MATLANLDVVIGATTDQLRRELRKAEKSTSRLKRKFTTFEQTSISLRGTLTALAGAAGMGFVAKRVFDLGSAVEETGSKFRTVFGPATQDVTRFIDEFGVKAGMSNQEAQELVSTTGAIAQGMGFGTRASADFAEEITRVAGDLSSFNNIPIAETSRAIQAALAGEREQLKRYGIVIREAGVQQKALAMTGKDAASALTQQEKAAATLELIMERAGVAIGDLDRTSSSAANTARRLRARWQSMKETLATALLPAMAEILTSLDEQAGGFDDLTNRIQRSGPIIAAWARFTVKTFEAVAKAIAAPIRIAFNLGQVIGRVLTAASQAFTHDIEGAKETLGEMMGDFGDIKDSITGVIDSFDDMRIASGEAWTAMQEGAEEAADAVDGAKQSLSEAARRAKELQPRMEVTSPDIAPGARILRRFNERLDAGGQLARQLDEAIAKMRKRMRQAESTAEAFASRLTRGFENLISGAKRFTEVVKDMAHEVVRALVKMAAKMVIIRALMTAFGMPAAPTPVPGPAQLPTPQAPSLGALDRDMPAVEPASLQVSMDISGLRPLTQFAVARDPAFQELFREASLEAARAGAG